MVNPIPENTVFHDAYSEEYKENVPTFTPETKWHERLEQAADNIPEKLREKAFSKRKAADDAWEDENISEETAKEMMDEAKKLEEQTRFYNADNT